MPHRNELSGKQHDAAHVEALPAEDRGKPAAQRQDDGVGHKIRRQHPAALILAGGQAAGDVRKSDIGDAGVENFHEGRDRDGEGDQPEVVAGRPGRRRNS